MSELSVSRPGWRARAVTLRLRSDDRLARDAGSGDAAAFATLYERHHQPLYRYCRSLVGNPEDAADALQSTMTRAFASIGERNQAAPVRAWLFRIAHNESISLIRRRRMAEPLDAETLVGPDVAADAEHRRRLADLVRDLQGLTERQRGALLMREVSGLGHAEIGAALGATEGAVKQSIYEARIALQELAMGREMSCSAVRRELSDGDGRTARARRLRGHLRSCEDCRSFRDALRARRSELALIVPVLPAATATAVLEAVIGAGGVGGGGLLAGLLGGGGAAKAVAVGAATVTAGAGAVTYTAVVPDEARRARAANTVERDDAGKGETRARKVPMLVEAVAKPEREGSMLVARDRPRTDGEGGHGSPPARERDDRAGRGPSGSEGGRDERDEDEERRKPSSGERDDDSSGEREDDDSADDEDDDSSGSGSGRREPDLREDSSGSGKGEAELAEDSSGKGGGDPDEEDESEPVEEDDAE